MSLDDFTNLLKRFSQMDMDEIDVEDNMQVMLEIMKFLKRVEPIVDKYVPTERDDEFNFNYFWKYIDGEQDGE